MAVLLQYLQQLGLQRLRQIPYLVEKQGRPLGLLKQAGLAILAEQLQIQCRPGQRGTVDHIQRLITPTAGLVQRLSHHPLAGTGRAHDQHRHLHGGDAAGLDQQLLHLRVAGQDQRLPLLALLWARQAQRMLYGGEQLVLVDGLGQKTEYPGAGRLNGIGNGAVGGHDDDRQPQPLGLDPLEQRQPVHAGHAQVAQHQIGPLLTQPVQRPFGAVGGIHLITLAAQTHAHQLEQAGIIINQQDATHFSASPLPFSLR